MRKAAGKLDKTTAIKIILILSAFISILYTAIYAAGPKIESISMSPANPGWGQDFILTMQICDEDSGGAYIAVAISTQNTPSTPGSGKQIFLVGVGGVNVKSTYQNLWQGGELGYEAVSNVAYNEDSCTDCGGSNGGLRTLQYNLTMPNQSDLDSSACSVNTLYLLVGTAEYDLEGSSGGWPALTGCEMTVVSWPLPTPGAYSVSVNNRVEGTLAQVGDLVLYAVDYTYGNGTAIISEPMPGGGCLALVDYGPNPAPLGGSVSAPATGSTSGTLQWTMPSSTYNTSGTVWMLLQMTCSIATGTVIANTATGTNGAAVASSTASLTIGSSSLALQKTQSINTFMKLPGDLVTITYYLDYQIDGDRLEAVRMFDDTATGSYSSSPPLGWKFLPQGTYNGTWTISDTCGTGDRIITGSVTGNAMYPGLLLDDMAPANVQVCTGIVEADAMINPGDYPGADALIILRSNGYTDTNLREYSLILSLDTAPANGYIAYQKCQGTGSGSCNWPAAANPTGLTLTANTWYRTKTWMTQNGNDYVFQSKVWAVGQPEPTAYQLAWTDTGAATTDFNCGAGATYTDWRPGVVEQGNDQDGSTQDSYNNFFVLIPRTPANTTVYDTVPTGLTYQGSNPAGTLSGGMVNWTPGSITDQSGSYTWWATTSACGQSFTNVAGIAGLGAGTRSRHFQTRQHSMYYAFRRHSRVLPHLRSLRHRHLP